eukprot:732737-Prymnesium_polylepis.1
MGQMGTEARLVLQQCCLKRHLLPLPSRVTRAFSYESFESWLILMPGERASSGQRTSIFAPRPQNLSNSRRS